MTTLTYAYKVVSTNPDLKVMEVEYSAEGFPTVLVGLQFPKEGVDLSSVIEAYAPVHHWLATTVAYTDVAVDTTGILTYSTDPVPPPPPDPAALAAEQLAFEQKVAAVLAKLGVILTDPTATPAAPVV